MKKRKVTVMIITVIHAMVVFLSVGADSKSLIDWYANVYYRPVVGLLYCPMYLYMIVEEAREFYEDFVIVRFGRKGFLLRNMLYSHFLTAFLYAGFYNTINMTIYFVASKNNDRFTESFPLLVMLIVIHTLVWFVLGVTFSLILLVTDKITISSFLVLALFDVLLLGRQSMLFTLRGYFPDIYEMLLANRLHGAKSILMLIIRLLLCGGLEISLIELLIRKKGSYLNNGRAKEG